ncbi:MAG: bifunctional methylenetetrahydrofolate dehydrogenase/methenyltetrahydrofolate cyclohydrolase FolD [Neisseriaceae bacterium]|nr:MAG: bifunctional methylenetetrahydrofolate dehydrogenase/methenyltetrahydrofolate cyclohydrolase FolD [Neisseriaceae bacterium]
MSAKLIDGKLVSEKLLSSVKKRCDERVKKGLRAPCLAVILVGDDPASAVYVKNKKKACEKVGIYSLSYEKSSEFTEDELLSLIQELNQNDGVDGILVQLPLPSHIDENKIIEKIHPQKDVDGFHPYNIGRLAVKRPLLRPCTPKGIMLMLEEYGIDVAGKNVTIVGQSNIVGLPSALEMLLDKATVTVCHIATRDLQAEVSRADIVVVGVGCPNLIKGNWIKEGAVVIDVGINRLENGELCGDVEFEVAKEKASYITPVPGGVGPMTIASLLDNTLMVVQLREDGIEPFVGNF